MNKITVAGAVARKDGVTLYLENGAEMNLPASSWSTQLILDKVTGPLSQRKTVVIDLDEFSVERKIEKQSRGFIKFLRETASAVGESLGIVRRDGHDYISPDAEQKLEAKERLVAVVDGKKVPGVEALESYLERAAADGDTKALERFLARLAKIIDKRGHTVEELLQFLKRADLPLANDGSIVAYKRLRSTGKSGVWVDCHSQKIEQRLGSLVRMPESKVDPSRRHACSTGLHIGRRDYVSNFNGDILVMVKIAPEDVIAVPYNEPSKMRVAAYHIVAELTGPAKTAILNNAPMTRSPEAAKLLGAVIAGKHIGVVERVDVGMRADAMAEISIKTKPSKSKKAAQPKAGKAKPVNALDQGERQVDVRKINQQVREAHAKKASAAPAQPRKIKAADLKRILKQVPEKWQPAFEQVAKGEISQREAEKLYFISAKKLRALLREHGIIN